MPLMTQSPDTTFLNIEKDAHGGAFGKNPIPEPTEAQCIAGNYKMGRVSLHGLSIAIEQPRGTYRTGIDQKTGKRWSSRMAAHYGYISHTKGADGDGVDCFVGPYPQSETAYAINQRIDGRFDEHKIMLAFPDEESARNAYLHSYERGWNGLKSIIPLSINQLKWWLKHGNKSQPIRPDNLPPEGLEAMTKRVQWNAEAVPENITVDQLLYQIRQSDDSGNGLLLDSLTIAEIVEDSDGVLSLDALVTPYAKLERKMELLRATMERAGGEVKPVSMQISEPFKQRGVTNIAVVYELSDGQTVSIYLHNPDTKPNKLAPADDLISYKWLLNKKDITIVVAPERGLDLNVREVSRRIMKLAEKNSAAFGRANAKRSERMQNIQGLKDEIAGLENELESAKNELEVAKIEAEDRGRDSQNKSDAFAQAILKSLIDDFGWKNQGSGEPLFWVTKEIGGGVKSMVNRDGIRRLSAKVWGDKIYARFGDSPLVSVDLKPDESAKENAGRLDEAVNAIDPNFVQKAAEVSNEIDPASPEGYAKIMADPELQLKYQDSLDALFQGRIVGVRNALRELGWGGEQYSWSMTKGLYSLDINIKHVGGGKNVVGVSYIVKDGNDFHFETGDSLNKTPEQIAAVVDASVVEEAPAETNPDTEQQIQQLFASGKILDAYKLASNDAETLNEFANRLFGENNPPLWDLPTEVIRNMTDDEFNAASDALEDWNHHSQNVVFLAKRKGTEGDIKDAQDFLKFHEEAGGLSFADIERRRGIEERINSGGDKQTPSAQSEAESADTKAAREFLKSVVDGDKDKDDLMALLDKIEESANAIIEAGKGEEFDALIGSAAEKWAELDKHVNG